MALQWRVLPLVVSQIFNLVCSVITIIHMLGRDQFGGSSGSGGGNKNSYDLFGTSDPFSVSMQRLYIVNIVTSSYIVCETLLVVLLPMRRLY